MSKKTHKMAVMKEEAKAKKPGGKETASVKRTTSGKKPQTAESRPASGKPAAGKGSARFYERPAAGNLPGNLPVNLLTVRVLALLTAAIAMGAGIYWIIQVQGNPPVPVIIGLIVLGFIAGLGIFTAVRAEDVVKSARAARKR